MIKYGKFKFFGHVICGPEKGLLVKVAIKFPMKFT